MTTRFERPHVSVYVGLLLVTLSTLTFEILLTRIFSVTLWYHFAFVAVSVAMFGMTIGALAVYLRPRWFDARPIQSSMAASALAFGGAIPVSVAVHLALPTDSALRLPLTYVVVTVPFVFSGVAVCLALTRFPGAVAKLYAVDLLGASLGCGAVIVLLSLMDGISAVAATASLAVLAALVMTSPRERSLRWLTASTLFVLALFALVNTFSSHLARPLVGIRWAKLGAEKPPLVERWNPFSRITVHADAPPWPVGWGLSPRYKPNRQVRQLWLRMDALAGTLLTEFTGDLRAVDYLRFDISNLAHYLRPERKILIIGAGGGRDVLSALLFRQRQITAIELNEDILDIVNGQFGTFTGHLDRLPQVRFVQDEARSWVARQTQRFDVIQASWIDTWAATAAGAFVLTENSLYTLEAWRSFLLHLEPGGIITFTRHYRKDSPAEAARMTALAREALRSIGIDDPAAHILLALNSVSGPDAPVSGNATILVSPQPFSAEDVALFRRVTSELGFEVGFAPGDGPQTESLFETLASGRGLDELTRSWPLRLDAPTDDQPFFFNMLSMTRLLDADFRRQVAGGPNLKAVSTLLGLLATVLTMALVFIALPLRLAHRLHRPRWNDASLFAFFAAIGLGFMLVEIALLQRLTVYLGHPTYGLSVVLFGLLLFSGLGSLLVDRLPRLAANGAWALSALAVLLAFWGPLVPWAIRSTAGASTPVRILVALGLVVPIGILMGTSFPLGMRAAGDRVPTLGPWLWATNGGMSVLASVLAVMIALESGISSSHWTGVAFYGGAAIALAITSRTVGTRSGDGTAPKPDGPFETATSSSLT